MDAETLRSVVVVALVAAAVLWVVSAALTRVAGTWDRALSDEERAAGARPERITLAQLGPIVAGRRDVPGGYQEYFGVVVGRRLVLRRRDHGQGALEALGFPSSIARKLDGDVMARLRLSLADGGVALRGTFEPQKVEFTHQPPRVTAKYALPGQPRTYLRVERVAASAPVLDDA